MNTVLPRWQHHAIWAFASWTRICGPSAAAILALRLRCLLTCHGAGTVAAPCHLGFCPSAGNPRLRPPHSSTGVGER
jgi:hypothetical protein